MKFNTINIGNSKGIRVPKELLKICGVHHKIALGAKANAILAKPADNPRKGWVKSFKQMNLHEDDRLLIEDTVDNQLLEGWD